MPDYVLQFIEADPAGVLFTTKPGLPAQWVSEPELDAARLRIVRGGTGRTYLGDHWICEQDVVDLHNAIRAARARYELGNDCRGCRNEPAVDGEELGEACLRSLDQRDDAASDWDFGDVS